MHAMTHFMLPDACFLLVLTPVTNWAGETDDLEAGQTSELVAIAEGTASTYVAPAEVSSWHSESSEADRQDAQTGLLQLQRLCVQLQSNSVVKDDIKKACAAVSNTIQGFEI